MELKNRLEELKEILNIQTKENRIALIKRLMNAPDFWTDEKNSSLLTKELKNIEKEIKQFNDVYELAMAGSDEELELFRPEIEKLEIYALLSGKYDQNNAIITFFAGAGGVDAQDWTEMLLRMYLRWAEQNDAKATIIDQSFGTEAGIKSATVEIEMPYVYGKLRGESGVHRLVRLSPFNAKSLRQTSFALVQVMPEIENDTEINIDAKDLRIDVYHSGGSGGQSVNTTDSAVRITHLPTNIVVSCQNERSQLQNKESAMKVLRSRLAQLMLEQHKEKIEEIRGNYSSPEWGNQIRSYVLHPYKMVKDHRTDFESSDPDGVLAGDLNGFIEAELRALRS